MKEAVPNYYHKFRCVADKCRHNCCIGWEIDIDEETMEFYNSMKTPFGEKIRKNIGGKPPHFVLKEGERCPFLTENGLCEIIRELGEEAICEICTLHPRFRNFYDSFYETGIGLCCQEAAQIILTEEEKFSVLLPDDVFLSKEERQFFKKRKEILTILQNREKTIKERFLQLAEESGLLFEFSIDALQKRYLALERLNAAWEEKLAKLKGFDFDEAIFKEKEFCLPMEQLAVYFIFRHLTDALWDESYAQRIRFALMSCYLIVALWDKHRKTSGKISIEAMADIARMYSAEVEYSQDNMEVLLWEI